MDAIFHRLIDKNFSELPGLTIDASIPVPEDLLNEIIEASLIGNKNIEYLSVSIGNHNRVSANIKTPLWPWPIHLKVKLFGTVDVSGSPKVRAFLENNILLGKLGSLFKAIPEGVLLYEDQVSVDIGSLLQTPEQKQYLQLINAAEIRTEAGMIILDIKIQN